MINTGVWVALVTPFTDLGQVDYDALSAVIYNCMQADITGFVVLGSTGESLSLTHEERRGILDFVRKQVGGQKPIIVGLNSANLGEVQRQAQDASRIDPSALMLGSPPYVCPDQHGLQAFITTAVTSWQFPTILYNVPKRTGVNLEVATLLDLFANSHIVGLKECISDRERIMQLVAGAKNNNVTVMAGNDLDIANLLPLGVTAAVSVLANALPQAVVDIYLPGEVDCTFNKLINEFAVAHNPTAIKWLLGFMGVITSKLRLPLLTLPQNQQRAIGVAYDAYIQDKILTSC